MTAEPSSQTRRPTKNEKRRNKKKSGHANSETATNGTSSDVAVANGIEVEYVGADYESSAAEDPLMAEFMEVFKKFTRPEELMAVETVKEASEASAEAAPSGEEEQAQEVKTLSKKKKKLLSRLSVAELKQLVPRPDVVEAHDITSLDPRLLVFLKSYRNTVPVPRHWCAIRKYLTGKRGVEKIPFQLPDFIAETGIARIRETVMEAEANKKGKQRARDRVRPKMGKIDIDYQVLHDAFFKYQTKPKLSGHGDLYYEGKEFEVHMKEKKPFVLSADLVAALGMTEGSPPPWLVNMQRYGPPPSYGHLRIPGLNAPLPPGAAYGYQPGGWGKPPVDEYGRPLYGDVFGMEVPSEADMAVEAVDKDTRWGVFDIEEEVFEEAESDEEAEDEEDGIPTEEVTMHTGLETPAIADGSVSMISEFETLDTIDLRKRAGQETPDTGPRGKDQQLYRVVQERKQSGAALGTVFGSDRGYVLGQGQSADPDDLHDEAPSEVSRRDGADTEDGRASRKRKAADAPSSVLRKVKDFKF